MILYHEVDGRQVETRIPEIIQKEGSPTNFDKKIRSFLDAARDGGASPVPSREILYNQIILDYIARSAECGHELAVEIPEV